MPIELDLPRADRVLKLSLSAGEVLFLLGPNGSGKSRLLHKWNVNHKEVAEIITAHRVGLFNAAGLNIASAERVNIGRNAKDHDLAIYAMWSDSWPHQRAAIALFDLIEAENRRARQITDALETGNQALANALCAKPSPLKVINSLMSTASLKFNLVIEEGKGVLARIGDGPTYPVAQLSDGERNAIYIAAKVLTAKDGTLLIIDEPERHLHRSIISPLLTNLFAEKSGCSFIISTHEASLPLDNPRAKTVLTRGCMINEKGEGVTWDADEVPPGTALGEGILREILGARRKVIFSEGQTGKSLDKPLYDLIFPNASVISKGNCREVENAVTGIRAAKDIHWVEAFGIVDSDGKSPDEIATLKNRGIYALPAYSIESIYYDPAIQTLAASALAKSIGGDVSSRLGKASTDALAVVQTHKVRLSQRIAEKVLRDQLMRQLPGQPEVKAMNPIVVTLDVSSVVNQEVARFESLVAANDIAGIFARYPVRETPALDLIVANLGFQDRGQYEGTVRHLVSTDMHAKDLMTKFFGVLNAELSK